MTRNDLGFYKRRHAQERAAERAASNRAVAAIHRRLADSYRARIEMLTRITRRPVARNVDDQIRWAD